MYIIASIFVLVYAFLSISFLVHVVPNCFLLFLAAASSFVDRVVLGYVRTCVDTYVRVGVSMRACAHVHVCLRCACVRAYACAPACIKCHCVSAFVVPRDHCVCRPCACSWLSM